MRFFIFFYLLLNGFLSFASLETVSLKENQVEGKKSLAKNALIFEDRNNELTISDILKIKDSLYPKFSKITEDVINLNFTSSYYWVAFKIKNEKSLASEFFLETAMPITNTVDLYSQGYNNVLDLNRAGDEIPFSQRLMPHRKNIFKISLLPAQEKTFFLHLKSDGEVLKLPIVLWESDDFIKKDYQDQFILGIYYGILFFVSVFFLFFYFALENKSFLYYLSYIFFLIILQLSLDGLAFQYLWPNNTWLASHAVAISACGSVFFINRYAMDYLNTKTFIPSYHKIFQGFLIFCFLIFILCFSSGKSYSITYPSVNFIGLVSTLFILVSIFKIRLKGEKVNVFFALAFISLIMGSVIFILSNFNLIENNIFTEHALKFGSALEVIFLSVSMAMRYRQIQQEKFQAQAIALEKLEQINELKSDINIKLEQQVKERVLEYEKQSQELIQKNKDITDSINYAKRIQQAILPDDEHVKEILPESFLIYKPKDIVSGDFYFIEPIRTNDGIKLTGVVVADSTGHGVPGALISVLGSSLLKQSLTEESVNSPAEALDFLNTKIGISLRQRANIEIKDGMDIAYCVLNFKTLQLSYAGAYNPLWIIKKNKTKEIENPQNEALKEQNHQDDNITQPENKKFCLIEIKADKQPIGYSEFPKPFTNHQIQLEKGDTFYIFSDGFADQFGGPLGKKFKTGQFKELLISIQEESMEKQKQIIMDRFTQWKGNQEQVDDVCVVGVRV